MKLIFVVVAGLGEEAAEVVELQRRPKRVFEGQRQEGRRHRVGQRSGEEGFQVRQISYIRTYNSICTYNIDYVYSSALLPRYVADKSGLVFVVDSSSSVEELESAGESLRRLLDLSELDPEAPVLVFANKHDLPTSKDKMEVAEALGLLSSAANGKDLKFVHIKKCSSNWIFLS